MKRDLSEKNEKKLSKLLNVKDNIIIVSWWTNKKIKKIVRRINKNEDFESKRAVYQENVNNVLFSNKLILELEKEKQIQEKKDFREELSK